MPGSYYQVRQQSDSGHAISGDDHHDPAYVKIYNRVTCHVREKASYPEPHRDVIDWS